MTYSTVCTAVLAAWSHAPWYEVLIVLLAVSLVVIGLTIAWQNHRFVHRCRIKPSPNADEREVEKTVPTVAEIEYGRRLEPLARQCLAQHMTPDPLRHILERMPDTVTRDGLQVIEKDWLNEEFEKMMAQAKAAVWREAAKEVLFKAFAKDAAIAFELKAKKCEQQVRGGEKS